MKTFILRNWKQTLVLALSAGDFIVMHYHPEWHDWEALIAAILATWGIRLLPFTATQERANQVAAKAVLMAKPVAKHKVDLAEKLDPSAVIPNLDKPFQDSEEDTNP